MANDKITRKDIVDGKVLDLGQDYAKSLQPAIEANLNWLKTFEPIKAAALEYANIEKEFKVSKGRKEFLEIKVKEASLQKETANAIKAERDALLKLESVENKRLQNKAKEIDIANKKLTLSNKEESSLKRKTKLTAEERLQLQLTNKKKKQLAVISSSLATAYEKESVLLVRKTRRYKDVAVQYGVNSKQAKRLQKELDELRNKLFTVDKAAGNFQRNVGNYPRAFGGAIGSIRQLASAAGLLGGAFLAIQVARDAARTIIEFDRQLIAVRKTTNFTKEETSAFSKEVVNLGLKLDGISIQGLLKSSEIAGQLGIRGSNNILKFSETLEKLKLTSDIVGDESARNFAKFIEVSSDSVENADRLGSVITELGNNFATTESQILKNTTEIQKGISIYDASAQSVIGLGAATSALGNEAEVSRGALQTTFRVLNNGATTGKNLERILKLTGQTAAEFRKEFANNSVETFRKFVKGLSDSDKQGQNLSNTLLDLGIKEKRATAVVGSLAKNYDTLEDALNRANVEYDNNQVLTDEANQAAESLASNIDDLSDVWDALVLNVESGDGTLSNAFKNVIGFVEKALKGLIIFNTSQQELTDQFNKKIENKFFTEVLDAYKEMGDAAEEVAIADLTRTDDFIVNTKKEIELLKERNKALRPKVKDLKTAKIVDVNELRKNQETIKELNQDLAVNIGINKAAELQLGLNEKIQKDANETTETATEKAERLAKAEAKANKERERANVALLRRRKLEKDANFKLESFGLNQLIKEQEAIIKNEDNSFEARQKASEEKARQETALTYITAKNKFDIAKNFSDEEIDTLLENGEASKATLKKVTDEELLIIEQFQAKIKAVQSGQENTEDGLALAKIKSGAEAAKAIKEAELNQALIAENEAFQKELVITDDREKAIEAHEREVARIKKQYALEALNVQVAALKTLINQSEEGSDARIEAERKLSESQLKISQLNLDAVIGTEKEKVEAVKLSTEEILSISSDLANAISDLTSAIYDARIQKIDEEIEASDNKYNRLLENELISDQQRKELEAKRERDREALEKKKAKEQRKQAVLAKATTALTIGLQTAAAIIGALAPPPVGLGPVAGIPLSVAVGAIGAIQLAAALAAPIPKYAKGTEDHPGGPAWVGEGKAQGNFVPEWVKEPNKKPYLVDKPTLLDLPKHTKVIPTNSLEDYQAMMRASMLASVDIDNKKLNSFQAKVSVNNNYDALVKEMQLTREAIKQQRQRPIHFHERELDFNDALWASQNRRWYD